MNPLHVNLSGNWMQSRRQLIRIRGREEEKGTSYVPFFCETAHNTESGVQNLILYS